MDEEGGDERHEAVLEECRAALPGSSGEAKASIYVRMGDAYKAMGQANKALVCYREAYDAGSRDIQFIERYAQDLADSGEAEKALALLDDMLKDATDPITKARLSLKAGLVYRFLGRYEDGIEMGRHALLAVGVKARSDPEMARLKAEANSVIGLNLWRNGDIVEAEKVLGTALEIYQGIGDKKGESDILNHLGIMFSLTGHPARALEALEKSRHAMDKARCYINIGIIHQVMGDLDEAENEFKVAMKKGRAEGYKQAVLLAQQNLASLYLEKGSVSKARTYIDMAIKGFGEKGQDPRVAITMETQARISLAEGDITGARAVATKALAIATEAKVTEAEAHALHALGTVAMAEGKYAEAAPHLETARDMMRAMGLVRYLGRCCSDLAVTYRKLGNEEGAKVAAEEARKSLEMLGARKRLEKLKSLGF